MSAPRSPSEIDPLRPPRLGPAGPGGGLAVGLCTGLLFGLADVAVAAARQEEPLGGGAVLLSAAAGVGVYVLLHGALGALLGLALRRGAVAALCASLGLFLELYWWTRPYLFWGASATSPERLGATAALGVAALLLGALAARAAGRLPRPLVRGWRLLAALALPLGALALGQDASQSSYGERGVPNDRTRDLPNVLLVVVDALRPDVLGVYGGDVETPVIDGLARRGALFENALVQAPFTWSSFGSILTGKYPRRHGMLKLGPEYAMVRDINVPLPAHLKSARGRDGRELRDEDWVGAAFMTGAVTRGSGLLAGFDVYCEALRGHDLVHRSSDWSRFRSELLVFLLWSKLTQRVDFDKAGKTAVDWIEREGDRRFFAFLHLYSTHTPYDPDQRFRERYLDPDYDGPIQVFDAWHRYAIESGQYAPTEADVRRIRDLYRAGTAQADDAVGRVLAALEARGVLDDTLVIVTADHGEELGEHGVWEHNWMYQTNLRVPLVMAWPGPVPAGVRVPALVETIDLFPTVCDLLGLELPAVPAGSPDAAYLRIDGESLMPLVRGERETLREHGFAESGATLCVQDAGWKLVVTKECLDLEPGDAAWDDARREPQLFDLAGDPGETVNLFAERPDEVRRLLAALRAWDAELPIPREAVQSSHRDLEAESLLNGLGYAEGIGDDDEPRGPRSADGPR